MPYETTLNGSNILISEEKKLCKMVRRFGRGSSSAFIRTFIFGQSPPRLVASKKTKREQREMEQQPAVPLKNLIHINVNILKMVGMSKIR